MIKLKLLPDSHDTPSRIGTIHHSEYGVACSLHEDFTSTLQVRRYHCGLEPPNYPMPAIPLAVKYDYVGCVNIDDVSVPDNPVIVWLYDSWTGQNLSQNA